MLPQSEVTKMQALIREREIREVVHFTLMDNLPGIVKHGLMSRDQLRERKKKAVFVDDMRLDGRTNGICLSLSFPNYKMFYKKRQEFQERIWVVLSLSPSILWRHDCLFVPDNAASNRVGRSDDPKYRGADALARLFEPIPGKDNRRLLRPCDPTNPQAEVIVLGSVPRSAIKKVYAQKSSDAEAVLAICGDARVEVKPEMFDPRADWSHWTSGYYCSGFSIVVR